MNKLDAFIDKERSNMLVELHQIVTDLKKELAADPLPYKENDDDDPSIDIRLCIDLSDFGGSWIFRTGHVQFDQYHSQYCGASAVTLAVDDVPALLTELTGQMGFAPYAG